MSMGTLVKIAGWYDNEMGYSTRLVELTEIVGKKKAPAKKAPSQEGCSQEGPSEGPGQEEGSCTTVTAVPHLEDLGDVAGKRVLVRTDFNVPLVDGEITDDLRIRAALPTLRWLQESGAEVTAMSHLGRPKGEPNPEYDMAPVRDHLSTLLPGVKLLDNLRFDPGETANDPAFVERLVNRQDLYVNDAFGASHRAHASIVGPPMHLPSAAGRPARQRGRGADGRSQ